MTDHYHSPSQLRCTHPAIQSIGKDDEQATTVAPFAKFVPRYLFVGESLTPFQVEHSPGNAALPHIVVQAKLDDSEIHPRPYS
jgi:hypothetical protein